MKFRGEIGQAMVEFALVLIPLLIIIGGIIDFGWIFYHKVMVNNAAREGARYAAIHSVQTETELKSYIKDNMSLPATLVKPAEPVTVTKNSPVAGDVKVSVSGDVDILTPFISAIFTDSNTGRDGIQFRLKSETIMKME